MRGALKSRLKTMTFIFTINNEIATATATAQPLPDHYYS